MAMIVFHTVQQGTQAWLDMRKGLWTGSTAIRLLQGKKLPPESDWDGFVDAALRGHALEVAAIREYERKYRFKVLRPGFVTNSVYWNAGYSPDGLAGAYLLECKAFLGEKHVKMVKGDIPLEVLVQIYFGMIITGKRKARLLAFNPEIVDAEQLSVIEMEYDKAIGNNIRKKLRQDMKKRLLDNKVI